MNAVQIIILIIAFCIILAVLVGIFLSFLPGVPLIFLVIFLYAAWSKFQFISTTTLIILASLAILSTLLNYLSSILGAKKFGASAWGVFGALTGIIFGLLFFGIFGLIIGPVIGAILFELAVHKQLKASLKAGLGAFVGFTASIFFDLVLAIIMIALFIKKVF